MTLDKSPMHPAELEQLGRSLHGPQWKSALGRDLGLTYRHILRHCQGVSKIPLATALAVRYLAIRFEKPPPRAKGSR